MGRELGRAVRGGRVDASERKLVSVEFWRRSSHYSFASHRSTFAHGIVDGVFASVLVSSVYAQAGAGRELCLAFPGRS